MADHGKASKHGQEQEQVNATHPPGVMALLGWPPPACSTVGSSVLALQAGRLIARMDVPHSSHRCEQCMCRRHS
jgi:hypothetical protein